MNPISQTSITSHWRWLVPAFWLVSATLSPAQTATPSASAATTSGQKLPSGLVKGILEEEANLDLHAAIKSYQSVVAQFEEQRPNVANAIFRLGECYRKLGQTNEATAQYERVVRDFPDQNRLVELSRAYLGVTNSALAGDPAPGTANSFEITADGKTYRPTSVAEAEQLRFIITMTKDSPDLVNGNEPDGMSWLYHAALDDRLAVAEFLLDHGADIERAVQRAINPNNVRLRPLQAAVKEGHRAMVELLLDRHALVDGRESGKPTPLELVAGLGYIAVAEVLFSHGANVNDTGHGSSSPLTLAFEGKQSAMAKFLIDHGADMNANESGLTVLHLAAGTGSLEWTKLLLAHKASVNLRDREGNTPLFWAVGSQYTPIPDPNNNNYPAAGEASRRWEQNYAAFTNIVDLLISCHADVNATNRLGQTVLHCAAFGGERGAIDILLDNKAEINAPDIDGMTPLFYSLVARDVMNVETLLGRRAETNWKNKKGLTPLWFLQHSGASDRETERIRTLLLAHGAILPDPPFLRSSNAPTKEQADKDFYDRSRVRGPGSDTNKTIAAVLPEPKPATNAATPGTVVFYGEVKGTMTLVAGQPKYLSVAVLEMKPGENANLKIVKLRRDDGTGEPKTIVVNVEKILKGLKEKDYILEDGDHVTISPKMFNF